MPFNPFPWVQIGPVAVMKSVIFLIGLHYMTGDETVTPSIRLPFIRPSRRKLWRSKVPCYDGVAWLGLEGASRSWKLPLADSKKTGTLVQWLPGTKFCLNEDMTIWRGPQASEEFTALQHLHVSLVRPKVENPGNLYPDSWPVETLIVHWYCSKWLNLW